MRILHQRGVQLPQQLSIVGFDDVVLARYLYPALTTMHYPVEQMARCAAQLAIQLYQGITPPPSSNHFNAELVIRDSVAPYFFTMNASSTVKTVMTIKLTLLM
ncbi:transcriptional regulator [Salmonella enterica subsp. enterica]|uniref:Transcriptional regulator n=1 Tax=Salmonella enterica I TaxID=59201 RepID=A0A447U3A0_SALET|nr:transcriptional regulator [Salmonella enterica subsp. enterica]